MSVTNVDELFMERTGEFTEGSGGLLLDVAYKRLFRVETDSVSDDAGTIKAYAKANSDLPWIWEEHDTDTEAIVGSIGCVPEDQTSWLVTVNYRAKRGDETADSNPTPDDPTEIPPRISVGTGSRYSRVADKAYDTDATQDASTGLWTISTVDDPREDPSVPVENSAEMPFDPPLMKDDSMIVISIVRNEAYSSSLPDDVEAYKETLNNAQETIAGVTVEPLQGRIVEIVAEKRWMEDGTRYFEVSYVIEVDRRGHVRQVLDTGYFTQNSNGSHSKIVDDDGDAITEPVKLNGSGAKLASGADPVYLGFITSFPKDWSGLSLPSSV